MCLTYHYIHLTTYTSLYTHHHCIRITAYTSLHIHYNINAVIAHDSMNLMSRHGSGWDQRTWTPVECVVEVLICMYEASHPAVFTSHLSTPEPSLVGSLEFDKDYILSMRLVAAASNLRASIFHIKIVSFHDCKGIHCIVLSYSQIMGVCIC